MIAFYDYFGILGIILILILTIAAIYDISYPHKD